MRNPSNRLAFTLIELLVVISSIASKKGQQRR
ncbi:MAG: prepilin-type N-terminal cleavage/methylation domain-containing protein [Phycisphaeraceae bacterium]